MVCFFEFFFLLTVSSRGLPDFLNGFLFFLCTAFEAEITSSDIVKISIKYGFNVMTVYKVRNYLTNYYLVIVHFFA